MTRRNWALFALLVAVVFGGLLVISACSRPTATPGGPGGAPAPQQGAATELPAGYPRAATEVPSAVPAGYVAPEFKTPAPAPTQ